MSRKPLNEQVVVICGASSGIGRETAQQFATAGASVVVGARSEEGLASLVREITAADGEAFAVPADVTDYASMQHLAAEAMQRYGRIDTWVHMAGVSVYGYFSNVTPDEFARVIETDLIGVAHGARAALPHLQETHGGFIGVSSVLAKRSVPLQSAYCAAKHGVDGFLEALRMELRYQKVPVTISQILPSTINTTFFNKARTKMGVKPLGLPPLYQPHVVAEAIRYVAMHPKRDFIVGGVGKSLLLLQRLSPRVTDVLIYPVAKRGQQTTEPKAADDANNLFAPIEGYNRVEGDFGKMSQPASVLDWFDMHPVARVGVLAGATAGVGALIYARGTGRDADATGDDADASHNGMDDRAAMSIETPTDTDTAMERMHNHE